MPDSNINVRIIADTSGVDKLTTAAQRMAAELARTGGNLGRIDAQFVETGQRAGQAAAGLAVVETQARATAGGFRALGGETKHLVALFDEFARGGRGQMVSTFGAMIRDSHGLSLALGGLIGGAGLALLINRARAGGVALAELGERVVNMAAAAGTTPHEFSLLTNALRLAGGNADDASRSLEQLGRHLTEALATPSSTAAKALASLGVSHEELRRASTDLGFALDLLATKFAEFADSPAKTADFEALLGRGFERLIPALRQGGEGFDELRQKAQQTGAVLSNQESAALADTAGKIHDLSETLEGAGVRSFLAYKGAIDTTIDALQSLIRGTSEGLVALGRFFSMGAKFEGQNALAFSSAFGVGAGKTSASGGAPSAVTLPDVTVTSKPQVAPWPTKEAGIGGGGGRSDANQDYEAFAEGERNKIEAARGSASQIMAVYDEWLARAAALYGQDSAQYRRVELEKATAAREAQHQVAESAEQSYAAQRSVDTSYLASFKANMAAMAAAHKITKQQMYGFDIEYTAQLRDELKKQLQAIIDNDNLAKADRQRAWNEMVAMEAEFNTRAIEEQAKAAEAMSLTWEQSIKQMSDQFADMTADVLLHTKTIKQAFDELVKSMLTDTLKSGFKGLFDSLLFGSGGTGSGGGGGGGGGAGGIAGDLFGGLGGGLLKMLGGDAASGLIGNPFTAGAGGLLGGSLSGLGGLFGGGATDAWGGIGAASASAGGGGLLSGIGGLFTGLFGLLGFEHGGIVPSAAGGWSVPSLGPGGVLAQLHSQEMVLPAGISGGLQSMIANGGGGHTFNIGVNAVDAGGVAKLFSSNGGALVQALNNALRHGSALYQS